MRFKRKRKRKIANAKIYEHKRDLYCMFITGDRYSMETVSLRSRIGEGLLCLSSCFLELSYRWAAYFRLWTDVDIPMMTLAMMVSYTVKTIFQHDYPVPANIKRVYLQSLVTSELEKSTNRIHNISPKLQQKSCKKGDIERLLKIKLYVTKIKHLCYLHSVLIKIKMSTLTF